MMHKHYTNFTSLYRDTLHKICFEYEHINAPRGNKERELIGFNVRLDNPRDRFCLSKIRKQNIVFNYAEALWYLSGKNDLAFISWYAPSMQRYSPDGISLPGTGYGARLKNFGVDTFDQIERAIDILKNDDPDSKRTVLQIFSAEENLYRRNIDVSCTLGLQLLLREEKLHMVSYMRANDAYVGMLNDIFSFTFLQEYIATRIGCNIGHYTHQVGSIHVYESTHERALELLNSNETVPQSGTIPLMPVGTSPATIRELLEYESEIRSGLLSFNDMAKLNLTAYWRDVLMLFWIYRQIKIGNALPQKALEIINPYYRPFLINRWGS